MSRSTGPDPERRPEETASRPAGRLKAAWLLAGLIYVTFAVIYTWPLALHPSSLLPASQGNAGPWLGLWTLGWDLSTITQTPAALANGRVFDANIFYPAVHSLAYTDHLLLQAVSVWPLYAATGSVTLCFNAVLLGSLVSAALAMFAFARVVTRSDKAALLSGLCWGFWPYHAAHLPDLARQGLVFLPLALLCVHRLVAARRVRDALLLGLLAGAQAISSNLYIVPATVALVTVTAALLILVGRWRNGRTLSRLAVAVVVATLVVAPVAAPYLRVSARGFAPPPAAEAERVAPVASFATTASTGAIYGAMGMLQPAPREASRASAVHFFGFGVGLLAAVAAWQVAVRRGSAAGRALLALVIIAAPLSMVPVVASRVASILGDGVLGSRVADAPEVFGVLVTLGAAGLAAMAIAGAPERRGLWIVALAVTGAEYANAPLATVEAPSPPTETGRWLASAPEPGPVVYLPLGLDERNAKFMFDSLQHGRPILNGDGPRAPDFYPELSAALRGFPDADALWALKRTGVRYVVTGNAAVAMPSSPLVERAAIGPARIYEVVWTVEAQQEVKPPVVPPPPRPAPMPLRAGEVASYQIAWATGGMDLPAGDVRMSVEASDLPRGSGPAAYRLEVMGSTAPWIARYYEAQDRFTAWTDANLMPRLYVEDLREGERTVQLTARYDSGTRVVTIAQGLPGELNPAQSFPLAPGARDPVSAFFYSRSRPLAPNEHLRIPINYFGQVLRADLWVRGIETVKAGARREQAQRIDVRIEYEAEIRDAPRAVVWLSVDDRRIPLVVDIDAGFGAIRATLVEYERGGVPPQR